MNNEHLITMANQIGDFFKAYPDSQQAKSDIASHMKRFWALRMRKQIIEHVQAQPGVGLLPIVEEAIKEHQSSLMA